MRRMAMLLVAAAALAGERAGDSAWTLLERGIRAYRARDLPLAMRLLEGALRLDGDCHDAHFYLGRIAERDRRFDDAKAHYGRIDARSPTFGPAAERLGHLALREGALEAAARHFEVHAECRPVPEAWLQLARVQLDLRRHAQAGKTLDLVLAVAPGDLALAELRARLCLETERFAEALAHYSAIVARIPVDTTARFLRGVCHERLGQRDRALGEWRAVLDKDPYHEAALRALVRHLAAEPGQAAVVAEYRRRLGRLRPAGPGAPAASRAADAPR
jgi:tetratricopeptide (TPR) repeat protein